uniref:Ig-like domain-containing protein n=1 Tax=Pygocentrus nattereri TaxID=42514 RepID=A0A3B4C931_PYGNA
MTFYLNLFVNSIPLLGVFGAEHIRPSEDQETDVNIKEGEPVTLKCSYDSSSDYVYLYWYRQYPNRALQYLLDRGARSWSSYSNTADRRFESTATRISTELRTTELRLSDTALYYCALRVGAQ